MNSKQWDSGQGESHNSIRERVLWGTFANSVGQIITLATGFFLTPFILHRLGEVDYGLWALIGSIVAYAWVLDFGVWGALVKFIAEYRVRGEMRQARQMIATAVWFYIFIGALTIGLSALVAPVLPNLLHLPADEFSKATWLIFLSGAAIGVSIPCSTPSAVLRGLQRFDLVNLVNTASTVLYALATVAVLLLGGGVVGMMLANIALSIAMQIPSIALINRVAPEMRWSWRGANRHYIRRLVSFSLYLFVQNVSHRLESKTDEIVIGAMMPISAVAPYSIARRLSELAGLLTDQFSKVFLPIASELDARNDRERLRALYLTGTRLVLAIFLPLGAGLIIFASAILNAWVGNAYAQHAPLVWILTLAGFISASQWIANSILQGAARHRPLAIMFGLSAIANLFLSLFLISRWGLVGVAMGTLIPVAIANLGLILPYAMRELGISVRDLVKHIIVPAFLPALPMLGTFYVLRVTVHPTTLPGLAIVGGIGTMVYVGCYLLVGASEFERESLRHFSARTVQRAKLVLQLLNSIRM